MKLARDLAVIGITAILVAPFARPRAAHADGDEQAAPRPAVVDLDGVALTIDDRAAKGGAPEAMATLTAVNRRKVPVERKVRVHLNVTPPVEPLARMAFPSAEKWSQEIALKLLAGETKTVELRTGVRVGAREIATFGIGSKRETALVLALGKKAAAEATKTP
ncbi:MAG: hypothetical protein ACYTF8_03360 [Planctomycetota bacterium]|jgi:hypothetical protein